MPGRRGSAAFPSLISAIPKCCSAMNRCAASPAAAFLILRDAVAADTVQNGAADAGPDNGKATGSALHTFGASISSAFYPST